MPTTQAAPDPFRRPQACALAATPTRAESARTNFVALDEDSLGDAIQGAPTLAALEALGQAIWGRWAAGGLADGEAQALAERVAARRAALKGGQGTHGRADRPGEDKAHRPPAPRARYPAPRPAPRRDRAAARERRRRLAASGPMPPALAARFTTGELASLKIVADEMALRGDCRLSLGEIAARAGVCVSTVRNALRAARSEGLLTIEERPRRGLPSLTNIVRIVAREWREWIARRRPGGGRKIPERTGKESFSERPTHCVRQGAALGEKGAGPQRPPDRRRSAF